MSPARTRAITSSGQRLTSSPCGTAMGMPLARTRSMMSRPLATVSPSGFSTRIAFSGRASAARAMSAWLGAQVLTHTTSLGQAANSSWCVAKVRMPGWRTSSSARTSARRSTAPTRRKAGDRARASRLRRPPLPPPMTLAVRGSMAFSMAASVPRGRRPGHPRFVAWTRFL